MDSQWNEEHLIPYLPTQGRTVVIVGANEGQWVKLCSPISERVIAIEADPNSFEKLRALTFPNVTVISAAAWMTDGHTVQFHVRDEQPMSSAVAVRDIRRNEEVSRKIDAETVMIDRLDLSHVDLMIVDTEGAELDVVRGATRTIERDKPDLILECHEVENRHWLANWLERCGYNLAHVHDPRRDMSDQWQRFVHLVGSHYRPR